MSEESRNSSQTSAEEEKMEVDMDPKAENGVEKEMDKDAENEAVSGEMETEDSSAEQEECGEEEDPADSGNSEEDGCEEEKGSAETLEDAEENPSDEGGKPEGKTRTPFFGKKKKEKDKLQAQIDDLTDRLKRNLAEFDNFRKRTEKEKASMYVIGAREIVEKILPVVDNFERGLAQAQEGDPFAEGMKMIYKQFVTALEDMGVKPIEAVGQEFDPNLHNAVMHVDDDSVGDNIVVEELQKGYMYKDFVVRHSMVKVAN